MIYQSVATEVEKGLVERDNVKIGWAATWSWAAVFKRISPAKRRLVY